MRLLAFCFFVLAISLETRGATAADATTLAGRLKEIAAGLSVLNGRDALYDRDKSFEEAIERIPHAAKAEEQAARVDELRALLHDDDAKIRTLAIVIAFRESRLELLPDIALLAGDNAKTFPAYAQWQMALNSKPPPLVDVAVGSYARIVIQAYLSHSDELERVERVRKLLESDPAALAEKLKAFAASRVGKNSSAELLVAMDRATGQMSPIQPEREPAIESVLGRLDVVPMPRRFFLAIAIDFDRFRGDRYAPEFLMSLARKTPRDSRLAAIKGDRGVDDPDLAPGTGREYILEHAGDLLRVSDVEMLERLTAASRSATGRSRELAAVAMLRPEDAEKVLIPAFDRFVDPYQQEDRVRLAVTLAHLGGQTGLAECVDWLFREKPQPGAYGFGREGFLAKLQMVDPVRFRAIVSRVVRDPRLEQLGPASSRALLLAVEGYLGRPLATEDEIRLSYGIDEAQRDTKFAPLKQWHEVMRQTLSEWDR